VCQNRFDTPFFILATNGHEYHSERKSRMVLVSIDLRDLRFVLLVVTLKLLLLYNKTLSKHVTALFCLYLGNVENLVNHFRNAPVGRVFKIVKINETVLRCIWY
jgi:hypothetical protein